MNTATTPARYAVTVKYMSAATISRHETIEEAREALEAAIPEWSGSHGFMWIAHGVYGEEGTSDHVQIGPTHAPIR